MKSTETIENMVRKLLDILSFGFYSKCKNKHSQLRQNSLMKEYGIEILQIFNQIGTEQNKAIWLEFGTLLGAYRDHSFIQYDCDMDLGMYQDQYDLDFENTLIMSGFRKKHFFYQYRNGRRFLTEVTWEYKGFQIDIFLCVNEGGKRHIFCYDKQDDESFAENKWMFREYSVPEAYPIERLEIATLACNSPADPKRCLEIYYGDSFMTPIADWTPSESTKRFKNWFVDKAYGSITIVR